jgi:hypothetical protein
MSEQERAQDYDQMRRELEAALEKYLGRSISLQKVSIDIDDRYATVDVSTRGWIGGKK